MKMLTRKVTLVGFISYQEPLNKNLFVFSFGQTDASDFKLKIRHNRNEKKVACYIYTALNYDYDSRSWGVQILNGSTRISYFAVFSNNYYIVEFVCAWPNETDAFLYIIKKRFKIKDSECIKIPPCTVFYGIKKLVENYP